MSMLLLALALVTPAPTAADDDRRGDEAVCSVSVFALDGEGQARSARRVSAGVIPVVVFQGRVSPRDDGESSGSLLFDVFNPRGQRYQVLMAEPRVVVAERDGHRVKKVSKTREARLAVAGSSIAWTSMYGRWRVEPRIEGTSRRCGPPEFFTIRP